MSLISLPKPDQTIVSHRDVITRDLQRIVGADGVIADEAGRRAFENDAFTATSSAPLAVVLPVSTEQVAKVLSYCAQNRIKVVPRGAGTSLSGAALPTADALVICLSRMTKMLDVDFDNRAVRAEAGITIEALNNAVRSRGFFYPPNPESSLACTLGGTFATNAAGSNCLKYGATVHALLGLTLVTIDGAITELGGVHLDAPGFDLLALVCGSEGQLGVITEATVRILPAPEASRPVLLGFGSVLGAAQCAAAILKAGIVPSALEFMDKAAVRACEAVTGAGYPQNVEALLIIEVEGAPAEISALHSQIVEASRFYGPSVIRISQNDEQSTAIWKGRRGLLGALGRRSDYVCIDAGIPLGRLAEVLETISQIAGDAGLELVNVLHTGDGTLHPVLIYDDSDTTQRLKARTAANDILRLCVNVGGGLSGENGIGADKRDLMTLLFTEIDLAVQMRVKMAFDPDWLMNSAKVFPLQSGRPVAYDAD